MSTQGPVPKSRFSSQRWTRLRPSRLKLGAVFMLMAMVVAACGASGADTATSTADVSVEAPSSVQNLRSINPLAEQSGAALDLAVGEDALSDGEASFAFSADAAEVEPATAPTSGSSDSPNASGSAGGEAVAAQLPDIGRDIIYTATLELASTDVSTATREAIRVIEARGGFVFAQDTSGGANGRSVLTFKILPEQFQAVLGELGSVGDVRSQSISADDVTAVVVDLESRINTAQASVLRLRNLLEDATELETIATLENQLLQRETSLEQLRGQLRTVQNQVDLATITVVVTELLNRPAIAIETRTFTGHDAGFSCFEAGQVSRAETGDPITTCYRITNTGDTPLVDVAIEDPGSTVTVSEMVIVDGDITQIDPGESVVLAHEFEMETDLKLRTVVTATGLDQNGNPLEDEVKATAGTLRLSLIEPVEEDGFPSFGEVLGNSWNALVTAAIVIALVAVAIAPFVAVALVLGFIGMKIYRRIPRSPRKATMPPPPMPPAPAAVKEDEGSDGEDRNEKDKETNKKATV